MMNVPLLRFIAFNDHVEIVVENLTALSVAQIKQLEAFASQRRGLLDFTTARISLRKRIDFTHFNKIIEAAGIYADTIESQIVQNEIPTKPEEPIIGFGKYRGLKYSDIPDNYLLWLKKNYRGAETGFITDECQKRKKG